ncbi:hypothetical protein [Actinomadura sp. HBU206391]|uniref:hypothetical protein n=1 Tax=Actinomadura sp. HBU206391 TaxID=2731692 RepID=UPI00164FF9C1|nr:hypothetical protein [Actinomadura sp. HBU206391]MBC6456369.1 hypothetical protein [Actinomadura sp. HBU206391]
MCDVECPHTHSPEEAAKLVGISVHTLRKRAGKRLVPSTKVAGRLRFSDDNIAQIIAAGHRPVIAKRPARSRARS